MTDSRIENFNKLLKGKSCFHIKNLDEELILEVKKVLKDGFDIYDALPKDHIFKASWLISIFHKLKRKKRAFCESPFFRLLFKPLLYNNQCLTSD